ncbi:hypothetical protein GWK47_029849 [Chionoecetes opilio]|uniref:Uncharacterized protein n=1 Tax=Chionoecetes opilio TaxID=41210 RepID=A0A8J4YL81_CHIOP|nr:hypothetical protein GWK47_029849 [Chionoecetes opilio]
MKSLDLVSRMEFATRRSSHHHVSCRLKELSSFFKMEHKLCYCFDFDTLMEQLCESHIYDKILKGIRPIGDRIGVRPPLGDQPLIPPPKFFLWILLRANHGSTSTRNIKLPSHKPWGGPPASSTPDCSYRYNPMGKSLLCLRSGWPLQLQHVHAQPPKVWLLGQPEPNPCWGKQLPKNGQVLRRFFHFVRVQRKSVKEAASLVTAEVAVVWEKARIPTQKKSRCVVERILRLYASWQNLDRSKKRKR